MMWEVGWRRLPGLALILFCGWSATACSASPLNTWVTSCGVDAGAIDRKSRVWTFRTSANYCEGGAFNQRAEINSEPVSVDHKGAYLFTSRISMITDSEEQFSIFSVHDARKGCAPPLQLYVKPSGQLWAASDVKTGPGESCIRGSLGNGTSRGRLQRDGTDQELRILIVFDGDGGFSASVWLDGKLEISGRYTPQNNAYRSKKFYFKHGVYSQHRFTYEMKSREMAVRRVQVK